MYKILAYFIVITFCVTIFGQTDEAPKDVSWKEINKLVQDYSKDETNSDEIAQKLINALQRYLSQENEDEDRVKIAINLIISVNKKLAKFDEVLKLAKKYITEDLSNSIQHFLHIEELNSLFNLAKHEDLVKSADAYLQLLNKLEVTDEVRVFQTKTLVFKAKSLIMLEKAETESIVKEIDKIIEKFENGSKILSVKLEKTELQRFEVLHTGAKLADWNAYDFDDEPVNLSDYNGKKVVLMFWASWEGKCSYFFEKKLEKFLKLLDDQNIEFIAISAELVKDQKIFLENTEFSCKFLFDKQSKVTRTLFVEGLPYFVYVDENSKVLDSGDLNFFDKLSASIDKSDDK